MPQTLPKKAMTKDKLMQYTLASLVALTAISTLAYGLTPIFLALISVSVALVLDFAMAAVMREKGPVNFWSAAVYGLVVSSSYSLANTTSFTFGPYLTSFYTPELVPLTPPMAYVYVAIISALGMVLFKKLQGLLKRKYVNPAAAAKLLVFLPFAKTVLLAQAHFDSVPLNGPIGYSYTPGSSPVYSAFGALVQACFGNVKAKAASVSTTPTELFKTLTLLKYHGWVGGASSVAVIIVGLGLFLVARKYIKWRITLSYLLSVIVMSFLMFAIFGGDPLLRLGFELFIGSSIFLAFFMATDPATTPITHAGQVIFGFAVGILTVLIQTYMGFLGGSILALVLMNLTTPLLDRAGLQKPKP